MPSYYNSTAQTKDEILASRTDKYAQGGRVGAKKGDWIQDAFSKAKKRGTLGRCTGKKFGSKTCPPGSKQYEMAKTLRGMASERKKTTA